MRVQTPTDLFLDARAAMLRLSVVAAEIIVAAVGEERAAEFIAAADDGDLLLDREPWASIVDAACDADPTLKARLEDAGRQVDAAAAALETL